MRLDGVKCTSVLRAFDWDSGGAEHTSSHTFSRGLNVARVCIDGNSQLSVPQGAQATSPHPMRRQGVAGGVRVYDSRAICPNSDSW